MSNFKKLLDHPEHDKIIGKLVNGDLPGEVAQYLKLKYHGEDEAHLRLSAALLKEFVEQYLSQYKFLNQVLEEEKTGKLDKKLAESLINNKAWKERSAEYMDKEIDLKKRIQQVIIMIEARAEQVFDKIQENPGSFKGDYVLIKYFNELTTALERADRLINERPDKLIQHDITIHMVEQHSVAFQEAIRELLSELDEEISARFMELLTEKLGKLKPNVPVLRSVDDRLQVIDKLMADVEGEVINGA